MATRKTSIEIDEDLLENTRELLGTETIKETVHRALLEVVRNRARTEEIEAMTSLEGLDLGEPEVMERAWRE